MVNRTPSLDHCYCPGCAKRIPKKNYGCPHCRYEDGRSYTGRLLTLREYLASPADEDLNDVTPAFLRVLALATLLNSESSNHGERNLRFRIKKHD